MAKKSVPNLVQGVTQQAVQQRRETQCEAQYNCINSVLTGCAARPASDLLVLKEALGLSGAYFYEIQRAEEHYLVYVKDGAIGAINLITGADCVVDVESGSAAYLAHPNPEAGFRAQALEDYTVIGNKAITMAMTSSLSAVPLNEALIFVKVGDSSSDYNLKVTVGASVYEAKLTTRNAGDGDIEQKDYKTNIVASFLERLLNGDDSDWATHPSTSLSTTFPADGNATWYVERKGSIIRLRRQDNADFAITSDASDSDTNFRVFKDTARALNDLPRYGFEGFVLKIRGAERTADDDYYVVFTGEGDSGYWKERVGPGLKYHLNPATMPHALFNDAPDHFIFKALAWSDRIAGDDDTAKLPSFVGKKVQDLSYSFSRFNIVVETGAVWAKSKKPFTFFPDTVQVLLDTAPVDINVPATPAAHGPSFIEKAVVVKENVYLWSQRSQFKISSVDAGFSEKTIEDKPDTNFEFASGLDPLAIGSSLFFAAEAGPYATIRNLAFDRGVSLEPVDVTRHVGRYVPTGLHCVTAQDTLGVQFYLTHGDPSAIYVYNWLLDQGQFAQSAWNRWEIPGGEVLWAGIKSSVLTILVQMTGRVAILKVALADYTKDPVAGARYQTRLDFRITQDDVSDIAFLGDRQSSFRLPWAPVVTDQPIMVVCSEASGGFGRGHAFEVLSVIGSAVTVRGDLTGGAKFYVGHRIWAERAESEFVLKDQQGAAEVPDDLTIGEFRISYDQTGYTRIEVTTPANPQPRYVRWDGREAGLSTGVIGDPQIGDGKLVLPVNEPSDKAKVRIINDTFLPSYWQSAQWHYAAVTNGQSTESTRR